MCEAQKKEIFNNTLKENKKLNQEIKRLKEEYVMLQNASDEVEEEKDKEIERLNKENKRKEKVIVDLIEKIDNAIDYVELYFPRISYKAIMEILGK